MTTTGLVVVVRPGDEASAHTGVRALLATPGLELIVAGATAESDWPRDPAGALRVLPLPPGTPAGEVIRQGLRLALTRSSDIVGHVAGDFATPPTEIVRLRDILATRAAAMVMGTRVAMLGYDIRRSVVRHYLGRVFAMLASSALHLTVYDTQCPAKLFRATPALAAALEAPFVSTVAFDVELLGRLLAEGLSAKEIVEVPLKSWDGTRARSAGPRDFATALRDLRRISTDLARRRGRR